MAQGKFSKPRGRFTSPRTPAPPERDPFDPWDSLESPIPEDIPQTSADPEPIIPGETPEDFPLDREAPALSEEEAMDHAFAEVTGVNRKQERDSGFLLRNKKILLVGG